MRQACKMNHISAILFVVAAFATLGTVASEDLVKNEFRPEAGGKLSTKIALVGSRRGLEQLPGGEGQNLAVIDPTGMFEEASRSLYDDDIEEDDNDRFITTRSGKRRPQLVESESEWAEDEPLSKRQKRAPGSVGGLLRKKRCNDDDDGDARRARRVRRRRARRARRARNSGVKKAKTTTTTTVTRKVLQNGQVVSQTIETQGAAKAGQTIVQPAQPVVQSVQPVQQVQPVQPVVVQQQPQPQAVAAVPSISVNGSIKVN